jgi:hypothetical protein
MFDIHWDGNEQPGPVTVHHPVVSPLPIAPFSLPAKSPGEGEKSSEVSCELCKIYMSICIEIIGFSYRICCIVRLSKLGCFSTKYHY